MERVIQRIVGTVVGGVIAMLISVFVRDGAHDSERRGALRPIAFTIRGADGASDAEKEALFCRNAERFYRI